MHFAHPFVPDAGMRAGRMMNAGRVKVTVTSLKTGVHITVLLKAFADNRQRQYSTTDKNWMQCPLRDATHVFCEVPNSSGWNDKVGTFYPQTGRWYDADNADPNRVWAAQAISHWLMGREPANAEFTEETECGVCGRTLTDPESIARGIGPECFGRMTESQHQIKSAGAPVAASQPPRQMTLDDDTDFLGR